MTHGKLIPFAKIDDALVRRIVRGFCCAESLAEIAAATGVSQKTCRSIILALRPRLLTQRFDQWRGANLWRRSTNPRSEASAIAMVFGCFAACYFNRSCYTNHQQGRRKARLCKACLIPALDMGEDYTEAALYQIDLIHGFYAVLGIGGERDIEKLTLFRLRYAHTQIVGEAIEATNRLKDGTLDFEQEGVHTVRTLYTQIIRSLEEEPLDREAPPGDPALAKYEDLTFLND